MASEAKFKQRKAPAPKASEATVMTDQTPAKKQKAFKEAIKPVVSEPTDAIKPEKKSRKRAADYFAGEEAQQFTKIDKSKANKSSKEIKTTSSTKPSKEDGHPIEIAKAFPGGDMVEVEPAKPPKSKKKDSKGKEDPPTEFETEATTKKSTGKIPKTKKSSSKISGETGPCDAAKENTTAEPTKVAKASSTPEDKVAKVAENDTATESSQRVGKAKKSKAHGKSDAHDSAKLNGDGGSSEKLDKPVPAKTKVEAKSKSRKGDAPPAVDMGNELAANTKDEGLFRTLLKKDSPEGTIKAITSKESELATSSDSRSTKPSNSASGAIGNNEKERIADNISSEPGKGVLNSKPSSKSESKSAKKRKATSDVVNLVDQLAETGSAQKRLRKAEVSTTGEDLSKAVKVFANSTMDTATNSAAAASEYVGQLVGGGQNTINDISRVDRSAVDNKKAAKKVKGSKKRNSKPAQEDAKDSKTLPQDARSTEDGSMLSDAIEDENVASQDSDFDEEVEDQTATLLKGFESSDDDVGSADEGYKQGAKIPKLSAKTVKELKKVKAEDEPGVVYIGRIPHGFYEQEMRTYFSQFGNVTKLRLSRNKKSGRSKHFAFLEFASKDVASIVAQTMNNYLMFGHILKCQLVPNEQVHENIWKGANRKFRVVPWAKIEARKLAQPASKEVWGKRIENEKARREEKLKKVKSIGYEFDVGTLKTVDNTDEKTIEEPSAQETAEAAPDKKEKASEKGKTKKNKEIEYSPKEASGRGEGAERGGMGDDHIVERTVTIESAKNNNGQLVVSEEITTKQPRKGGRKGKGAKTAVADAVVETTETAIPAARIAVNEIAENISNVARAVGNALGNAIGPKSVAEAAMAERTAKEDGTTKRDRKRKAKENVEAKPAKRGKTNGKLEQEAEPVTEKRKDVKEKNDNPGEKRKDKSREGVNGQPVEEKSVEDKTDKKGRPTKEKKLKVSEKDKKAVN